MSEANAKSVGIPPKEVHELVNLAEHNDDSIVSRTLINSKSGSLTLFAFAAGQALSEHTCPYDALAHVLEGEGEIVIDGEAFAVGENKALLMPANVPHAVNARKNFKMLLTMFKVSDNQ